MVWRNEKVDALSSEAHHVPLVLLSHEPQSRLILEAPLAGPRCEELVSGDLRPALPAGKCQDVSVAVVATVPVPHEKTDEALVGLVHLLLAPAEAHTRRIDN